MNIDFMKRAIELAKKGTGAVNPNPLVGAVIVKDDRIIGEGYHRKYGELHAERDAFAHLTEDANGAEMYVTLEPCCHFGKQPPCTDAIIERGIKKVYVGSDDPNTLVSGKGYELLRSAGIEVVTHVLKDECDSLNKVFFHYIVNKTPYVLMKYAMTMDGKTATHSGKSKWISNEKSRANVMKKRNELMAIMVGIETVLKDDPMLTCRIEGGRNPIRIICDSNLRIPKNCQIASSATDIKTIIASVKPDMTNNTDIEKYSKRKKILTDCGMEIIETTPVDGHVNLSELMNALGERGIDGILLEGGGTLNYSAVKANIVNQIDIYISPKIFGGSGKYTPVSGTGVDSPELAYMYTLNEIKKFDDDIMLSYVK